MKRTFYSCITVILIGILPACMLRYIDAPPVVEKDRWIKKGFSKDDVSRELDECGYSRTIIDETQRRIVGACMLSKGFVFIDSPYGTQGAICIYPKYQKRLSCQSLKGHQ
jgi:hypothetical protein